MSGALILTLTGIAALDSLNPALFVAQLYLLTTPQPTARVLTYIVGVLAVNLSGGVLLLGGARAIVGDALEALSGDTLRAITFAAGVAILAFGLSMRATPAGEAKQPRSLRPIHGFALGAAVMLNEITTALPYFVAVERVAQAGLGLAGNAVALVIYNLVFAAPLLGFLLLFLALRARAAAPLARISAITQRWVPRAVKYGSIAFGAALALDALAYFASGTGILG